MIESREKLQFFLKADLMMNRGHFKYSIFQRIKLCLHPDYVVAFLHSLRCVEYYSQAIGLLARLKRLYYLNKYERISVKCGFSIAYNVFDYGLVIPHIGTIVVGGANQIGKYAVLHTSTCITDNPKIIGDGLYLSSGAMLTCKGIIGNNVMVAANSVVTKPINSENVLYAGMPAQFKRDKQVWYSSDEKYLSRVAQVEKLKSEMKITD